MLQPRGSVSVSLPVLQASLAADLAVELAMLLIGVAASLLGAGELCACLPPRVLRVRKFKICARPGAGRACWQQHDALLMQCSLWFQSAGLCQQLFQYAASCR